MTWGAVAIGGASLAGGLISANAAGKAANTQQQSTDKAIAASQGQYNTTRNDLAPYRQAGEAALSRLNTLMGLDTGGGSGGYKPTDWSDAWHRQVDGTGRYVDESDPNYQSYMDGTKADLTAHGIQPTSAQGPGSGSLLSKFSTADLNADPVYNSGLQFGLDEGTKAINARAAAGGAYDSGATLKALTRFGNDYGSTKAADAYGRFNNDQNSQYQKLAGLSGIGLSGAGATSQAGTGNASNLASLYSSQGNATAAAGLAGGNAIAGGINSGINNYNSYNMLSQLSGGGARAIRPDPSLTGAGDLLGRMG